MPHINVEHVGKDFGADGSGVRALNDVSFSISSGKFTCVMGPSGCGKTTLLRIIGDLVPATDGIVRIGDLSPREARRAGMFSWVFQAPVLMPWRDLIHNVSLPLEIQRNRKFHDPGALLELVGLKGFEHYRPSQLSGGMQQRAAIARALTFDPEVLLMDEPFSAVDEFTRAALNEELLRIFHEFKITIVFVTHSIMEAVFLADQIIVLSKRPGTVRSVIDVPIARPRQNSIRMSVEFQELVKCVESSI
jgi:NitT/TauT family transport system ATP-binding protein